MMTIDPVLAFYALPLLAIWTLYAVSHKRAERRALAQRREAVEAGLSEPTSLHPVIDTSICVGCKACLNACPEGSILGLIGNKAQLVEPASCIGHGACKTACPRGAISLVFGTATRGIDLPVVSVDFQTNVPGIYIAGELGGMGLIRNAIEQGRQAMDAICDAGRQRMQDFYDVCVIGSGPAGLSASLRAKENGLTCVTLEQDTLGGTVAHFPRGKIVMTAPVDLPVIGKLNFKEIGKEKLLGIWQEAVRRTGLKINFEERVVSIEARAHGFCVTTNKARYQARAVLLAIGRRGTPRKLGVPGEDSNKVCYRLIDARQYRNQHVLVVGGGDSALEAASAISEEPGAKVTLSYRSKAFGRAKPKNRARVEEAARQGRIEVLLGSQVETIAADRVVITQAGRKIVRRNDTVIVCAGGILPDEFLKGIGIGIETKYGTA